MGKRKRGTKEAPSGDRQLPKRAKTTEKPTPAEAAAAKMRKLARVALEKRTLFPDNLTADDRKEEGALYELLGSEDTQDRVDAAGCIIARLLGGDGATVTVLERHLDKRLFRGLASGRNASRIGFSLVITEILGQLFGEKAMAADQYPALRFERILQMLIERTEPGPNIPGQEERDNYFGRLFGLETFVKAGILSEPSRWLAILDLILALSAKKVWIRSQCGWLIVQAIGQMDKKNAKKTLEKLAETDLVDAPEGVAIWITASDRFPGLSVEPWCDPFSGKRLNKLSQVLREQTKDDSKEDNPGRQAKQPNWTAQLHFVWDIIIEHLIASDEEAFATFWQTVIDDGFFSKTASDGQKFRGFMILQATMQAFSAKGSLPLTLFSPKLMASLMNQAAKEDRYLNRAALKVLKAIEGLVSATPDLALPVLKGLLGDNGDFAFDQRTHTKAVEKVIGHTKPEDEKKVVKLLRKKLLASVGEEQGITGRVRTYIDYLARLVQSLSDTTHTSSTALGEICELAYTTPEGIPEAALTEQTRGVCRKRLESVFAMLITKAEDFGTLSKAVSAIDHKSMNMGKELKSQLKATIKRTKALAKEEATSSTAFMPALSLLYAVAILQLYNQDPDALNTINDLDSFYDQLTTQKDMESGSSFLVETLLSLVVRPSSLMRQVSQKVFEVFSEHVNEPALKLLTDPLLRDENTRGQAELFDTVDDDEEDDDMDEEDSDEVDEELDAGSDVGFSNLNDAEDGDENEENDDENDNNNEEEGSGDEGEGLTIKGNIEVEDPEGLESALESLLNTHRLDKDADAESSSEADVDMSDSEMLALDEKIAAAFKQRVKTQAKNTKKQQKDAKDTVVNFKHRILDLLDIYVTKQPTNPLAFGVLVPVLQLMRTTTTKPLANRAGELVQTHFKGIRKARHAAVEVDADSDSDSDSGGAFDALEMDAMVTLLGEIHVEASRDNSHAFAKAASSASLVVVSAMFEVDDRSVETAAALYATTQAAWVLGEVKMQPSFFSEWVNWCQSHASKP